MVCKKCGEEIKEGAEFCIKCGTKVENEENFKEENIQKESVKEKNDSVNNSNSTKTALIIIFSIVGSILLIILIVFLMWLFIFKKSVDTYKDLTNNAENIIDKTIDKIEEKVEKIEDKVEEKIEDKTEKKSDVVISLYKPINGDVIFSHFSSDYSKNVYENEFFNKVGSYECYSYNCKFMDGTLNKVLIYDNDYILYDINTKKETTLNLNVDSSNYLSFITYDKVIYGISVSKNNKSAYYDINKQKYITDFIYSGFNNDDSSIKYNKLIAYKNTDDENPFEHDYYVIDINNGKVLLEEKDLNMLKGIEYNNYLYFVKIGSYDNSKGYNKIYNDKLELILEDVYKYGITKNGNIMITKDNKTFSIYDKFGNLIKTSKEYSSIKLIVDNYVAVIDDDYLKLIDYNEEEVAKFTEWTDKMNFHELLSGYYMDNTTKVKGVYLVIEDEDIKEGVKGRGKEYYYGTETKETGVIELEYIGGYAKPVLYLYPNVDTYVEISFDKPNMLTTTYPKYINNWSVKALPNGDLYDSTGRYYYGLYWEEIKNHDIDFKEGFYVTSDSAIEFLEEKLDKIGFNNREANEFIMYWLPILEANKQSIVYFELTEEREAYNKINIKPNPDSLLRVAMHVKKVDSKIDIKEQDLPTFNRYGFSAVEWGGVIH